MAPVSLVTGVAGFLGAHVADSLLREGHRVVGLDDLSGGFCENVPEGVEFHEGSILDVALVERLFREHDFTYVFHLAAYAAEGLSHFIRRFNYQNNLLGSVNLINASVKAGGVKCFVFTSSIAVYGAGQVPMREEMMPAPEDPYGISKLAVELDLKAAHEQFGLNYIIFRPHNVYGEKQNLADPYRNVVGIFMRQVMRGEPMTIFGDGSQTRAFSHHSAVCPVIAGSVTRKEALNHIFNVGAGRPHSVKELAETVAAAFGMEPRIQFLPARNEVQHAWAEHAKADQYLAGLGKEISLEEGIRQMAAWARNQPLREPRPFTELELTEGLPPSWRKLMERGAKRVDGS